MSQNTPSKGGLCSLWGEHSSLFVWEYVYFLYICGMAHLRKVSERTNNYIDSDTGELLNKDNSVNYSVTADNDRFVFLYGKFLKYLTGLSETDMKIFIFLTFNIDSNTHTITSNKMLADRCTEEIGVSGKTFFNCISKLCGKEMLIKDPQYKGVYRVNPEHGWKGSQKDRSKVLKIVLIQQKEEKERGLDADETIEEINNIIKDK